MTIKIDNYIDLIAFITHLECKRYEIEFVNVKGHKDGDKGLNLWILDLKRNDRNEITGKFFTQNEDYTATFLNETNFDLIRYIITQKAKPYIHWQTPID